MCQTCVVQRHVEYDNIYSFFLFRFRTVTHRIRLAPPSATDNREQHNWSDIARAGLCSAATCAKKYTTTICRELIIPLQHRTSTTNQPAPIHCTATNERLALCRCHRRRRCSSKRCMVWWAISDISFSFFMRSRSFNIQYPTISKVFSTSYPL